MRDVLDRVFTRSDKTAVYLKAMQFEENIERNTATNLRSSSSLCEVSLIISLAISLLIYLITKKPF